MISLPEPGRRKVEVSPLAPWPEGRMPLLASETVGTVHSSDAEHILGELITEHHLSTTSVAAFAARFRSAPVGPIQVVFQQYDGFAGIDITEPLTMVAMTIPLTGDLLVKVDGRTIQIPAGSPLVFNPGDNPRMMGPATADFLTLTMPRELLVDAIATRFPKIGEGREIVFGTKASRASAGALAQAIWTIQQALDLGHTADEPEAKRLTDQLVSSLLLSHPHSLTRELYLSGSTASDAAVWDAVAVLRAAPQARVTIAELARDAAVSTRSLQTGFLRLVGVTPSEFQRDLRLEMAYRIIDGWDHPTPPTVHSLMVDVGYVNPGRFAADFRERFGLYPSEAIRARFGAHA